MAMTLPLSPASDANAPASPVSTGAGAATNAANTTTNNNNNNNTNANANGSPEQANAQATGAAGATAAAGQMKRKPSRRANTAERRATHNAVERQRRETLNGRFLVCIQPCASYLI